MSEPTGVQIEIGGELCERGADTDALLEELLQTVQEDLYDIYQGPGTLAEFKAMIHKGERIQWDGTSNYGSCDDTIAWCRKHNIGYEHNTDSTGSYDASVDYWIPGMKEPVSLQASVDSGRPVIQISEIRPLCELMLNIIKSGTNMALALYLNNDGVKSLVENLTRAFYERRMRGEEL